VDSYNRVKNETKTYKEFRLNHKQLDKAISDEEQGAHGFQKIFQTTAIET